MRSLDAILFDLGGTLDGRGGWRDRFHRLFAECGLSGCSREQRVHAFDCAERRLHTTPAMETSGLRGMLRQHVAWQCESLRVKSPALERDLVDRFVREVEQAAAVNRPVLASLVEQGFRLAVVSNACGNAAVLCDEYGYAPMLSAIVDSRRLGASKPDLAIFRHAIGLLDVAAERAAFVGDSLDRDIEPAKALGMRTFWIANRPTGSHAAAADVVLDTVADLPASLLQAV